MASMMYNNFKSKIGVINWATDNFKVMLLADTYTVDIDNHDNLVDIEAHEVTGTTNYTVGGLALTGNTITRDDTTDTAKFVTDTSVWPSSTITARYAAVYLDTGNSSTATLVSYVDFLSEKLSSAGDFIIQWHADGVFKLS